MKRKKILIVTELMPYPLDSGGKIKTYRTLEILSEKYEVHLVCFSSSEEDLKYKKELERLCKSVKVFVNPKISARYRDVFSSFLRGVLSLKPLLVNFFYLKSLKKHVDKFVEENKVDVVWIDHINMAQYLPKNTNALKVFEEHNVNYLLGWRNFLREGNLFQRVLFLWEAVKFYFYEKILISKFDRVMAISDLDKKRLVKLGVDEKKVVVNSMFVPFKKRFKTRDKKNTILFVGTLSWWPNKNGVEWFVSKVFPLVKRELPDVRLIVVGDGVDDLKQNLLSCKGVEFLGYVEELDRYYEEAAVFVVPIFSGGGIRVKILNAMAAGLPVVATSLGLEGIDAEDGDDVLVADEEGEFADKVLKVLRNEDFARKLSRNAVKFIRKNYGKNKAREKIAELVEG